MNSQPDHRAALEAALLELDAAWTLLTGVRLGWAGSDYLLLHPQHGAALVDLAPGRHDGVRALRAFLEEQDFTRFFAGNLPVVHLTLEPGAERELCRRLGVAFAASERATIADPEWAAAIAALITAKQSREAWLGAPTPAADSVEPDASDAHFAASGRLAAAAATGTEERVDRDRPVGEAADDASTPAREMHDLAPRMPRWQTVAAFASLAVFGALFVALPGETPRTPPAVVEVAIAPDAPHGGSGPQVSQPSIARAPQPTAAPTPGPSAVPPAPAPRAATVTPVTIAEIPPLPAASLPPEAPPPAPDLRQPPFDPAAIVLPEVAEAAPPAEVATAKPRHAAPNHASANELAVNALPPPPPRPERPHSATAAAPAADAPAAAPRAEREAEPAARPVQPVSDLIHRNCRVYSSRFTVLGEPAEVRGFACQAADGSWEIMSEAPARAR